MHLLRPGSRLRQTSLTSRAMGGVSAAWNPSRLTGLAATLLTAESRSRGLLWQNTAKTTPATADGDPVRVAVCPYTGIEFTAPSDAARPLLWDEGGGKWSLSFDGVDDEISWTVSGWTGFLGSLAARFRFGPTAGSGGNRLVCTTRSAGSGGEYYDVGGLAYARCFRSVRYDGYASLPVDTTLHTQCWVNGADYRVFLDGTQRGLSASLSNNAAEVLRIGRSDTGNFFAGLFTGSVLANAAWDDATRLIVETYLGAL